jgi:hypothetical protein
MCLDFPRQKATPVSVRRTKHSQEPADIARDPGKTTHALPRTANPLSRRMRRLAANVAIRCPEISLRLGREDHTVSHLSAGYPLN